MSGFTFGTPKALNSSGTSRTGAVRPPDALFTFHSSGISAAPSSSAEKKADTVDDRLDIVSTRLQSLADQVQHLADQVQRQDTVDVRLQSLADQVQRLTEAEGGRRACAEVDAAAVVSVSRAGEPGKPPTADFYEEAFYSLTESGRSAEHFGLASDQHSERIVVEEVRRILNSNGDETVTRGDIVLSLVGRSTSFRGDGAGIDMGVYCRALDRLDDTLGRLCELGLLAARVCVLTREQQQECYYSLAPRGMHAFAFEWMSPGVLPPADFRLLGAALSEDVNSSLTEMAAHFGSAAILRLTAAGLIVRKILL